MWHPTGLVLGPGGIKGFMELGFLLYMEKNDLLPQFDSIIGVSIGSVIGLLYTAGYSIIEIINEASKTNIMDDISQIKFSDIKENAGLIPQQKLRETLEGLIKAKFGKVLTMGELYQATGIHLHITSLELDKDNPHPVYFSHLVEPNISCVEAVLLSANIPLIFRRLYYKGKSYVDGALADPYPIHVLDDGKRDVLGIYIAADFDKDDNFITYVRQIIYAGMVQIRNLSINHSSKRCRHVGLHSKLIDPIGLTTNADVKVGMVTEGFEIAKQFFEQNGGQISVSPDKIDVIEGDS